MENTEQAADRMGVKYFPLHSTLSLPQVEKQNVLEVLYRSSSICGDREKKSKALMKSHQSQYFSLSLQKLPDLLSYLNTVCSGNP